MHRSRSFFFVGSFVIVCTVAAVGCGGSDNSGSQCDPSTDPSCACDPSSDASCTDGGGDGTILDSGSKDGSTDAKTDAKTDGAIDGTLDGKTDGSSDGTTTDTSVGDAKCQPPGGGCTVATDCCNLDCTASHTCASAPSCLADGTACSAGGAPCCSTTCGSDGTCTPLSTTCKTTGNPCGTDSECCSTYCNPTTNKCDNGGSFCLQTSDICVRSGDCCSGFCSIPTGGSVGTCGSPPGGPAFCAGGKEDGERCGTCTDCCSRVCAPYGTTGVFVCQRAEGCHVTGDLCTTDTDCCGAAGTGLPGDGHVTCDKSGSPPGSLVGICRNPLSCNPEGNVCHYEFPAGTTCGVSSTRNDCCDHLGSKTNCELDPLGVPRCHAVTTCRAAGETCADSADCCGGLPCVPDSSGVLHCGATTCEPVSGPCTTDADCCPGGTCHVAVGSVSGTCTPPLPPPPSDAGVDSGPDGSTVDSGTPSDSGAPSDSSTTTDSAPPVCSTYGQRCTTASDCCSASPAVPCTDTTTGLACAGGTSCYCVFPLH